MLKVFWKWLNHGIQSCQWKHLLFSLPQKRKYFSKKKKEKKYSIWVLIFLLFSNQNIQSMRREQEKKVVPELRNPVSSTRLCWFLTQLTQSCCLGIAHLSVMPAGDGCWRWPGRDKGCTKVSFPQHLTQPEHRLKTLRGFQPSSLETKQAGKVEKRKKRKAGVGGKYYIPNWIAWNFLTHVWKNQITSIKAALLWHQHPLRARRQLTHCLPRDHRDWPQDLCVIPARSRQRSTWTALSSSVKGGGPAWSLRWGVWDRGLQKPLSIHLAHYISLQIIIFLSLGLKRLPGDQTGGFNSQNGFCRQVAVTKAGFLSQITSVVSFKCHSGH